MKKPTTHPDQVYIKALLENDTLMIQEIYKKFSSKVIGYVIKNSGSRAQALDLIQECLMIVYDQAKTKDLQLTCPFDAYFFLICKRKWWNILKKKGLQKVTIEEERLSIVDESHNQAEESLQYEAQRNLYLEALEKIGDSCKQLIKLSLLIKSMQEVADKLDISYAYARKRKSVCMAKLMELIQGDPMYKQLKNS